MRLEAAVRCILPFPAWRSVTDSLSHRRVKYASMPRLSSSYTQTGSLIVTVSRGSDGRPSPARAESGRGPDAVAGLALPCWTSRSLSRGIGRACRHLSWRSWRRPASARRTTALVFAATWTEYHPLLVRAIAIPAPVARSSKCRASYTHDMWVLLTITTMPQRRGATGLSATCSSPKVAIEAGRCGESSRPSLEGGSGCLPPRVPEGGPDWRPERCSGGGGGGGGGARFPAPRFESTGVTGPLLWRSPDAAAERFARGGGASVGPSDGEVESRARRGTCPGRSPDEAEERLVRRGGRPGCPPDEAAPPAMSSESGDVTKLSTLLESEGCAPSGWPS